MSRLKNFSRNLTTSYLQLAVNVGYSLVSVPIILHWLPKAEFGLWAVLVQLMSYLVLVDLGINQAVARLLVDHKDRRGEDQYGSLLKTAALVSLVQGVLVLAMVWLAAPLLASVMDVSAEHGTTFVALMRLQGVIAAFTFCTNPLMILLNAHQRMDIIGRQSIYGMLISLGLLVFFLNHGLGVFSFIYASAIVALLAPIHYFWSCWRLGFLPEAGRWGRVTRTQFREIFGYGWDVFLLNVGIQLVAGSQTVVVSCRMGFEAAGVWSIGTKVFMLIRQLMFLPSSAASAGMAEMLARGETERLRYRFQNLVTLTASLGVFFGVGFALCNSLFVGLWTRHRVEWAPLNDVLLAVWLFAASVQTTHCGFAYVNKQIQGLPRVLFLEGLVYIGAAVSVGYGWGMPGIITCSALCLALFSGQVCLRRSARYFHLPPSVVAVEWLRPSLRLAAVLVPLAVVVRLATAGWPPFWQLAANAGAAGILGGMLFLRLGLPGGLVSDLRSRLPRPAARLLEKLGIVPLGAET